MSRPTVTLFPNTQERAVALGRRLRAARLRRRMSEREMAARALLTRPTLRKMETGDLSVTFANIARVLEVLGLEADLDAIGSNDQLGHSLADARTPLPHRTEGRGLADEL